MSDDRPNPEQEAADGEVVRLLDAIDRGDVPITRTGGAGDLRTFQSASGWTLELRLDGGRWFYLTRYRRPGSAAWEETRGWMIPELGAEYAVPLGSMNWAPRHRPELWLGTPAGE